jgi:predicted RecA/RadA family phage recombinase
MQSYLASATEIAFQTAPGAMTVDVPYVYGGRIIIPCDTVAAGEAVTAKTSGLLLLDKVSGAISNSPHTGAETIAENQRLYWDATNSVVTGKSLGLFIGYAAVAAGSSATKVRVLVVDSNIESDLKFVGYFDASAGKAIGTHELMMFGPDIPAGFIPTQLQYDVHTTFTSATDAATIALGVKTDDEDCLKTALAISNGANPYAAGVVKVPTLAVAGIETTAARKLVAVVASEALTAGSMTVYCWAHKSAGL